jgi:hypothetical protein
MSLDKNQAGLSTSTLNDQLASATASHLRTSSIKQPTITITDPTPDEAVRQVAANIISTLDTQYQASLSGDSSSNSSMTNMDHVLNLIPTEVINEQVAQIAAIFNVNTAQATNIASTHAPTLNLFTTQIQTRTQTHASISTTPGGGIGGYGGGSSGGGGGDGHTPVGSPPGTPRGGGGRGGLGGSALSGLAQIPIAVGGNSLMGQSPGIYDGDHAKLKVFMERFEIWRWLNCRHPAMANPSNQIIMFCMHLLGPKVDGWVCGRVNELGRSIVAGNANPDAEILWIEFWDQFQEDFQDTTVKEDALHKLMNLQMQGDDLDTYTTMFNDVMSLASFEEDALGTIVTY